MKLTALILTFNEAIHLERCLANVSQLTSDIVVVDSFSTDQTIQIAQKFRARILQRAWENNHATQVNWALSQLPFTTEWVMRIDADEILTPTLIAQIQARLPHVDKEVNGISCIRKMVFQGKLIRFGGVGANRVLRLFRFGFGQSESRWMDEHIKVAGQTIDLSGAMIDDNLRPLDWWIEKHKNYATREAVDLLNLEYQFSKRNSVAELSLKSSSIGTKRWIKESIYAKLPGGSRALAYFFLRYLIFCGFLDGLRGSQFHYLQAYWYRSLADRKVAQVKYYMHQHQVGPVIAIQEVLGIAL